MASPFKTTSANTHYCDSGFRGDTLPFQWTCGDRAFHEHMAKMEEAEKHKASSQDIPQTILSLPTLLESTEKQPK